MATAQAARTYQGLYAIYERLNAFKSPYWMSLAAGKNAKGEETYLMVDTAYLENEVSGNQHLAFAVREHNTDFTTTNPYAQVAARDVNGRFNFRFLYWPTQDSLHIEADGFNQKNIDVLTKYWADRTDDEITLRASVVPGYEQNLVKIAVLGGGRREATIFLFCYYKAFIRCECYKMDFFANPFYNQRAKTIIYHSDKIENNTRKIPIIKRYYIISTML